MIVVNKASDLSRRRGDGTRQGNFRAQEHPCTSVWQVRRHEEDQPGCHAGQLGIEDVGGLRPIKKRAKVRDLLTGRSGVNHKAATTGRQQFLRSAAGLAGARKPLQ